ncbi:MAG: BON domain-containing protein [Thermomicrobiales bacterium]
MTWLNRSDNVIQKDVLAEFLWDPAVDAPDVGVEVDDGVVTLTGTVDTFAVKLAAEEAAQRVAGVRAVANDLTVRKPLTFNDTDIAREVANALEANIAIPANAIDVTVQNGRVTLKGTVERDFQRAVAANTVRYLRGVRDLVNLVAVTQPSASAAEVSLGIKRALARSASLDADRIHVATSDGHVHLTGTVHSWTEKREAGLAAWRATGVREVDNDILVGL